MEREERSSGESMRDSRTFFNFLDNPGANVAVPI